MASCDMCGRPATTKARVEGAVLMVCASCASYGKELVPPKVVGRAPISPLAGAAGVSSSQRFSSRTAPKPQAPEEMLAVDYAKRLRAARLKMGLNEEEAASRLAIQKSTLLHYESGRMAPDDSTTKKLERFYGLKLTSSPVSL